MIYSQEIEKLLEEDNRKIEIIKERIKQKKIDFTKNFFKSGDRVVYMDRDGSMEGTVIRVDNNLKVEVMIDKVNGEVWETKRNSFFQPYHLEKKNLEGEELENKFQEEKGKKLKLQNL